MQQSPKVVAIANQKGGVGKTTTTEHLGIGLARQGKKVLLIGLDPQPNLTSCLGWKNVDALDHTVSDIIEASIRKEPVVFNDIILHHDEGADLIPDYDKVISVIRSREISVSIILQSLTQLNSLYGTDRAKTIIANCDQQLYLGGQDIETVEYISKRANRPFESIIAMRLDEVCIFIRGTKPIFARKNSAKNAETSHTPGTSFSHGFTLS